MALLVTGVRGRAEQSRVEQLSVKAEPDGHAQVTPVASGHDVADVVTHGD